MDLMGKSAIVTGGGKGIGRATVAHLTQLGAHVIAISRTQADLDALADEYRCQGIAADLADPASARAAMAEAGTCDYLINCAGTNVLESVLEMTDAGYDTVMDINLRATLVCAQEFARSCIAADRGGAIVNVTSIAAHRGFADHLCYAASKAGVEGATRVLARELGPHGIRVVGAAPTVTMTELAAAAWSDPAKSQPMMDRHPIGRFASAEDVAMAIVMLLSPAAGMVSGSTLAIDGGFLAV